MTKRIFRTIFIVATGVFLISVVLFMGVLYDYFSVIQHRQLRMQTDLAVQGVIHEGAGYFEGLSAENYRVTWVGTDGTVLYDSETDPGDMENHLQREEIREARAGGYGESSRYSATLMERYLYCARYLPDGTVLRISVTQNTLLALTLGMIQPIFLILIAAVILSLVLASRLSKKIVRPLNGLNLDEPLSNDGYDELSPLLCRIDKQQRRIRQQSDELWQKKQEFETVTTNMAEGIVFLNSRGIILSINPAACTLLKLDQACVGQDIISVNRSLELAELLRRAQGGEYAEKVMELCGGRYQFCASPIVSDDAVSGAVLLLLDVTEKEKSEQMRREFTANVSHELKTPLHTISGCAELLANGMVKQEDVAGFSNRIYTESQRLIQLVEDIIRLSHLDENYDMKYENVDLYALAEDTIKTLSPAAQNAGVRMELDGEAAVVSGVLQLLGSILYNLCDNAVKYNRRGGTVSVTVKDEESSVVLSVADTGIGIPAEHQERIFERFYRVDKSHSREIGGTGLGLSIVKHAARLHGAAVELRSAVDEGSVVTLRFPKSPEGVPGSCAEG